MYGWNRHREEQGHAVFPEPRVNASVTRVFGPTGAFQVLRYTCLYLHLKAREIGGFRYVYWASDRLWNTVYG